MREDHSPTVAPVPLRPASSGVRAIVRQGAHSSGDYYLFIPSGSWHIVEHGPSSARSEPGGARRKETDRRSNPNQPSASDHHAGLLRRALARALSTHILNGLSSGQESSRRTMASVQCCWYVACLPLLAHRRKRVYLRVTDVRFCLGREAIHIRLPSRCLMA